MISVIQPRGLDSVAAKHCIEKEVEGTHPEILTTLLVDSLGVPTM